MTGEQQRPTLGNDKADCVFTECTHALDSSTGTPTGIILGSPMGFWRRPVCIPTPKPRSSGNPRPNAQREPDLPRLEFLSIRTKLATALPEQGRSIRGFWVLAPSGTAVPTPKRETRGPKRRNNGQPKRSSAQTRNRPGRTPGIIPRIPKSPLTGGGKSNPNRPSGVVFLFGLVDALDFVRAGWDRQI